MFSFTHVYVKYRAESVWVVSHVRVTHQRLTLFRPGYLERDFQCKAAPVKRCVAGSRFSLLSRIETVVHKATRRAVSSRNTTFTHYDT